jgi:hypothetical protein
MLYIPVAEFCDCIFSEIAKADANDEHRARSVVQFTQWRSVEGIGNALAIEWVETIGICGAAEQGAVLCIGDLKNISAGAVACAKSILVCYGIEDGDVEVGVF